MSFLTNLVGQSDSTVLTNTQIQLFLENGASSDYTVRTGVIGGMSNGTPLTGSGGYITPSDGFDETTETNTADNQTAVAGDYNFPSLHNERPEAKSVDQVRFDGSALKVAHVNGDTVLYICVITSAGDISAKYVS